MSWIHEHSLSLVIAAMWLTLTLASVLVPEGWWMDYLQGLSHDTFGALVIVICTKYFIERGSAQSK